MNFHNQTENKQNNPSILYFLSIILKWKNFILFNVISITLLSILISFLLPKWYESSSTIMPPKNPNPLSILGLAQSNITRQFNPLRSLGTLTTSQDIYNYMAILKSRNLLEKVVTKFNLLEVYDIGDSSISEAIDELKKNMEIKATEEGSLQISLIDKDKYRASEMINFIISSLDEINKELAVQEAKNNREFIEERTNIVADSLNKAEEEIKIFQEKHGFIAIPEQVSASVSGIAELYAMKTLKELELQILKRTTSPENFQYKSIELELEEIEKKLMVIPNLSNTYFKLYRDFIIQKKLYETLVPMLEQAKIEEMRNTPTLLVLDKAIPAEKPKFPRKKIIVLIFFFLSIISSIAIVFTIEKFRNYKINFPDDLNQIKSLLLRGKKHS